MSIRFSQIPREVSSKITFFEPAPGDIDVLAGGFPTEAHRQLVVSLVRTAMREEACDKVPTVIGAVWRNEFDEWGNDLLAEVEYAQRGWRATFGGHFVEGLGAIKWSCYMD